MSELFGDSVNIGDVYSYQELIQFQVLDKISEEKFIYGNYNPNSGHIYGPPTDGNFEYLKEEIASGRILFITNKPTDGVPCSDCYQWCQQQCQIKK